MDRYASAKEIYKKIGVDPETAMKRLSDVAVSMHCWQGDDVRGFENKELSGGIQTTGNYPGRARNPQELMADIDKALSLIPGRKRINLHANYAIFAPGEFADRDALEPRHFEPWVAYAKERGLALDFNPTYFSHPFAADNLTLSSPNEEIRNFWIRHGIACLKIASYFAKETGSYCLVNFWIPDGYKDTPADRLGPRQRFADSMDKILNSDYDKKNVKISIESKVFGIGLESYTVGSAEFGLQYALSRGVMSLMDNGHYHPTEKVSDKISSMLLFNQEIALHLTRGVRWDSDHVIRLDDETREICKDIVACDALNRVLIATDYFDASINRVAAWVIGMRNVQKALLEALLLPLPALKQLQDSGDFTQLLAYTESLKNMPFGDIWDEYCKRQNVPGDLEWFSVVRDYEQNVLLKR
ncbi:MAG: L-rhamnose isomerase [Clostridia bacterium]|nr:L-rhamnose isomerase [Clostridia bacterium]